VTQASKNVSVKSTLGAIWEIFYMSQKGLVKSGRIEHKDKKFNADIVKGNFSNILFLRLISKGQKFTNVNFKYTIFENSYLRNCVFESCDFTGCRFVGTNLYGSSFHGCKFEYAIFERTIIDDEILATSCPGSENLKLKFARSLRMNYQQMGEAKSVNKAINIELQATETHLDKAWSSKESYYRHKYRGLNRFRLFMQWLDFQILDFIWGNGESLLKLGRTILIILVVIALSDDLVQKDPWRLQNFGQAFMQTPRIFFGLGVPKGYSELWLATIACLRLLTFGLFVSIIVKRFSRR
jgi:Pentapeptide repeats (9 copies)